MIYLKWLGLFALDVLLHISMLIVPQVLALFTKAQPYKEGDEEYSWGGWWGTYDNPPQGDEGFVEKRATFPNVITGWKGYVNRVHWMWRNPLYGFQKQVAVEYDTGIYLKVKGNLNISDKYKVPGYYFVRAYKDGKLVGFEYYLVKPYKENKCIRIRLGWKFATDKFERYGFAQLVDTINPVKKYGK